MQIGAIIQARCASVRLPNKVLFKLPFSGGPNVLQHIANRVANSSLISTSVIATTATQQDDQIEQLFPKTTFRGDESNVLSRYYHCAASHQIDIIVRLSGDNPCIDIEIVDSAIESHIESGYDYSRTTEVPLGSGIEIISFPALQSAYREASDPYDLEHVTPYIRNRPARYYIGETAIQVPDSISNLRLTLDYPSDYAMLNVIFGYFGNRIFTLSELAELVNQNKWISSINPNHQKQRYETPYKEWEAAVEVLNKLEFPETAQLVEREIASHHS